MPIVGYTFCTLAVVEVVIRPLLILRRLDTVGVIAPLSKLSIGSLLLPWILEQYSQTSTYNMATKFLDDLLLEYGFDITFNASDYIRQPEARKRKSLLQSLLQEKIELKTSK